MRKIILINFLSIIFLIPLKSFCQNTGNLYFFISPDNAIIRIDTSLFHQKKEIINMKPGKYQVKMWAPGRKLMEETLVVNESGVTFFRRKLEQTPEYKKYRFQKLQYSLGKIPLKIIPLPLTLILASTQNSKYKKHSKEADKALETANNIKATYPLILSQQELNAAKTNFEYYAGQYDNQVNQANKSLKAAKITLGAGIAVSAACYYVSILLKKPTYTETPLLSGISLNVFDKDTYGLSCVINLPSK